MVVAALVQTSWVEIHRTEDNGAENHLEFNILIVLQNNDFR